VNHTYAISKDPRAATTVSELVRAAAEAEVEMQQLERVHSAYVVGIPDRDRGQLVW